MKKLILILCFLIGNIGFAAEVVILHTSDTHGKISPVEYNGVKNMGGFSKRVNFVNEIRQEHKNVLLLDQIRCNQICFLLLALLKCWPVPGRSGVVFLL